MLSWPVPVAEPVRPRDARARSVHSGSDGDGRRPDRRPRPEQPAPAPRPAALEPVGHRRGALARLSAAFHALPDFYVVMVCWAAMAVCGSVMWFYATNL